MDESISRRDALLRVAGCVGFVALPNTLEWIAFMLQQSQDGILRHVQLDQPESVLEQSPVILDIMQYPRSAPERAHVQQDIYNTIAILAEKRRSIAVFDAEYNFVDATYWRKVRSDAHSLTTPDFSIQQRNFFRDVRNGTVIHGAGLTGAIVHNIPYHPVNELANRIREQDISIVVSRTPVRAIAQELGAAYIRATARSARVRIA